MKQDAIFTASESDRWFERNRSALDNYDFATDIPLRVLEMYGLAPKSAIEIGAANGYRIAELARRTGCAGAAVEPSALAIADGKQKYPKLRFFQGEAIALPIAADEQFDLVIVNYVLHWIDRANLFRTVAELDRITADGGFLLIGDFNPWAPTKVRYHHRPDVELYTYKQDYASLFVASGLYQPVCFLSGDGHALSPALGDDARAAVTLLRKRSEGLYKSAEFRAS